MKVLGLTVLMGFSLSSYALTEQELNERLQEVTVASEQLDGHAANIVELSSQLATIEKDRAEAQEAIDNMDQGYVRLMAQQSQDISRRLNQMSQNQDRFNRDGELKNRFMSELIAFEEVLAQHHAYRCEGGQGVSAAVDCDLLESELVRLTAHRDSCENASDSQANRRDCRNYITRINEHLSDTAQAIDTEVAAIIELSEQRNRDVSEIMTELERLENFMELACATEDGEGNTVSPDYANFNAEACPALADFLDAKSSEAVESRIEEGLLTLRARDLMNNVGLSELQAQAAFNNALESMKPQLDESVLGAYINARICEALADSETFGLTCEIDAQAQSETELILEGSEPAVVPEAVPAEVADQI